MRHDGRAFDQLREVKFTIDFLKNPLSSVLVEFGNTKVLCTVSLEEKVPPFLKGTGTGWITAEYAFIPGATLERTPRETMGRKGRSMEIQRLIGRVLRGVVDLSKLGERTLWIDCEVLNADGGTRTASVTGAFLALTLAVKKLIEKGVLSTSPVLEFLAGVSVGKIGENFLLDLDYQEDIIAEVDANFFMTESGKIVEIQASAEKSLFTWEDLEQMKNLAFKGIKELINKQKEVLGI
ncbi:MULTISPECIES: ribonuclease PH [Thermodesulfobacterium]|jgi:ribonuclease PH|uniref:Ribonuclease PH n=2 Tax=Thermodesulfobacterium commune TaxID=1741 RepID=A0A075WRX6_9BACT|nr:MULTISPECIES: ribonuclease PH [Thermodesulfobacterium]HAA83925.1 ribonuclease PH [Thermodesulfobacterium commune]AIH03785.1 ribonuclease PH [Thermodesulfobacterium commune DSM 2178]HBT04084.1 ribonuclease PH [Thermodesulfobacterium commune]HCE79617.1 ribonuclease PH [Thermodesulfobacterium commune]HCP09559.1 ribonuclease PH [Thermodesulfobacterium commune]